MKIVTTTLNVVLIFCCLATVRGRDDTLVEFAAGKAVVEAVSTKIDSACIFQDDNEFLRRLSYVETKDGLDDDTFTSLTHKGIWKMDEVMFDKTKSADSKLLEDIKQKLQIDWKLISWNDLQIPIHGGLAVRLYLLVTTSKPIPRDTKEQASYWKLYYNLNGDEEEFIKDVNKLENGCDDGLADVVFLLDSSGSIGTENFLKMKKFLKDVIETLNIGSNENNSTRVSVVSFADDVKAEFRLDSYHTVEQYHKAIDRISYMALGTNTHLALKFLVDEAFDVSFGARPTAKGVPNLGIILTDGMSNYPPMTAQESKRVHDAGINMISIGIGAGTNDDELTSIASEPKCRHKFQLDKFVELDHIKDLIEKKTCQAPVNIEPGKDIATQLPVGGSRFCKIEVSQNGTTIKLYPIGKGEVNWYLSRTVYPNPAHYDKKLTANSSYPVVEFLEGHNENDSVPVFCMLEGDKHVEVNVSIESEPGNKNPCDLKPCQNGGVCRNVLNDGQYECKCPHPYQGRHCEIDYCSSNKPCLNGATCISTNSTERGYICLCPSQYTGINCDVEIPQGYNCKDKNPCTPQNIAAGKFYFPHEIKGKFVQCSQWGQCFEMDCPPGMVWNPNVDTCTFGY